MGQALNSALQVIDVSFFELFCEAVGTALEYVRQADAGKTYIGTHKNWPELQRHEENGLPWITTHYPERKDYSDAIGGLYSALSAIGTTSEPPLDFSKEQSFLALVKYAKANPRLRQYLILDDQEDFDFGTTRLQSLVGDVLDCYIHRNNTTDLDRSKLLPIYLPIEKHLFAATLPVIVVVPILFLNFDFSQLQISQSISVEQLSDEFHIARAWRPFGDDSNSLVESAATHGLFIRGLSMENENWLKAGRIKMDPESYPVEQIDTLFAAIRIVTGYPTGYAQVVSVPVGWTASYAADIAPLSGPRVEKYPPFFKRGYWKEKVPTVSSIEAEEVKQVFDGLQQAFGTKHAQRVRLAMNRLNLSSTRTADEDGIIDSIIAMEALLSDGIQEMAYKVAMRLAALYKTFDRPRAMQVFREMKQIYGFRSKVVHGSADLDKDREIKRGEEKVLAIDAALEHLRNAFAVLIKNPALLDPKKIDAFLLIDTL